MLKLQSAQRIPLSQFCSFNHAFLIKHRELCLELPYILSCQSNWIVKKNIFEICFRRWKWTLEDYPLLCGIKSSWSPSLKRQESQRVLGRRDHGGRGRLTSLSQMGPIMPRAHVSLVLQVPRVGRRWQQAPPTLNPDDGRDKLPHSSGVPPLLCI